MRYRLHMAGPAPDAADAARRRLILHVALPVGLVVAAWALREALAPVVAALFLAYAFSPLVDRLQRHRVPRSAGSILVLAVAVGLFLAVVLGLLPVILGEFHRFAQRLPEMLERVVHERLPAIEETFGVDLPDDLRSAIAQIAEKARGWAPDAVGPIAGALGRVLSGAFSFFSALFTVLLVPILTYFFLRDFPDLVASVRAQIPERHRRGVEDYVREVDGIMGSYLRGQLLVVMCLTTFYAIGLQAIGLHLGLEIGLAAGVLSFVPYAGFVVGLALALLMAAITFEGTWTYVGIGCVFAVVQAVEGLVLTPMLVGRRLGLGTVWVLVAVLVFGSLLGFTGVLLAVPLGAVFRASARRLLAHRDEPAGAAPTASGEPESATSGVAPSADTAGEGSAGGPGDLPP